MKRNFLKTMLGTVCLATLLVAAGSASAVPTTLDVGLSDPYALGDVISGSGVGGGQAVRDAAMVNTLLTVGLGSTSTIGGDDYQRTVNVFSPLPAATTVGSIATPIGGIAFGSGTFANGSVFLTLPGGFRYLVAQYDGRQAGVEIWDIASIASGTVIEIPRNADNTGVGGSLLEAPQHQISTWTLLNPISGDTNVPDGGSTIALLGFTLVGVDFLRRRIVKA
jgi:hypothetical protein